MNQKIKTKTAPKQTLLSLIILGVLAIISGGVFLAQFNFNPAVQQMAPVLAAGDKSLTAPPASADKSLISSPAGQSPLSPLETFDTATLSDKINGKAELYLSAGFIRLHSQRFKDQTAGDVWMEVFVYDMRSPQNAFSVFSVQRREDAQTLDVGQYAYQTENAIFFAHGPFYVEIVASDISRNHHATDDTVCRSIHRKSSHPDPNHRRKGAVSQRGPDSNQHFTGVRRCFRL